MLDARCTPQHMPNTRECHPRWISHRDSTKESTAWRSHAPHHAAPTLRFTSRADIWDMNIAEQAERRAILQAALSQLRVQLHRVPRHSRAGALRINGALRHRAIQALLPLLLSLHTAVEQEPS